MDRSSAVAAGLYGLLVGDALGVPYEFHDASNIPAESLIEMAPPTGFRRSHAGVPPGTWSDDGSQALCLFESLTVAPALDLDDFARRLQRWYRDGHLQAGGRVFDLGIQTHRALEKLAGGESPLRSGGASERENGNGSLMRVLPVALLHDDGQGAFVLIDKAMRQSVPTHAHPRSLACCAQLVLWADGLIRGLGVDRAWDEAAATLRRFASGADGASASALFSASLQREVEIVLTPDPGYLPAGSGYVVDSLWSARWALKQPTYERVARAAIRLGNDTDTTAAIAGGLAGIRDGLSAIPPRWLDGLRDREVVDGLLARVGSAG